MTGQERTRLLRTAIERAARVVRLEAQRVRLGHTSPSEYAKANEWCAGILDGVAAEVAALSPPCPSKRAGGRRL